LEPSAARRGHDLLGVRVRDTGVDPISAGRARCLARSSKAKAPGEQLDVLIAGDDEEAKRKVWQLVSDGGLRLLDVRPLACAQQL
jgi:predicted dinucleotide-binding enzyme